MTPTPRTPSARAFIACQAFADGSTNTSVNRVARMAGYQLDAASPAFFFRGRCYRRGESARCVIRNGRIVRVSRNAWELSAWFLRLGSRPSGFAVRRTEAA